MSAVAAAMATKPQLAYSALPAGAPTAKATYIAVPTHDMTVPVFCVPTRASPQMSAPATMKLSAPPSKARPKSKIVTDI
jgi:hypothetical protein